MLEIVSLVFASTAILGFIVDLERLIAGNDLALVRVQRSFALRSARNDVEMYLAWYSPGGPFDWQLRQAPTGQLFRRLRDSCEAALQYLKSERISELDLLAEKCRTDTEALRVDAREFQMLARSIGFFVARDVELKDLQNRLSGHRDAILLLFVVFIPLALALPLCKSIVEFANRIRD